MSDRNLLYILTGVAALITVSACAYDPYYHPLAAHPYYESGPPAYYGQPPYGAVYVEPDRRHWHDDHHWHRWHDGYDND